MDKNKSDLTKDKKNIRKEILQKKKNSTQEQHQKENLKLISLIENNEIFKEAKLIMAFWPMKDEVDLRPLMENFVNEKEFLLPCVAGDQLILRRYKWGDTLYPMGKYKIMEPKGEEFTDYDNVDLILVPGMAFDRKGGRLGRGAAYYDKLLPKIQKAAKIGLGFSYQLIAEIPMEAHDFYIDDVIIPSNI